MKLPPILFISIQRDWTTTRELTSVRASPRIRDITLLMNMTESFYATKEERRKNAKREYEKQMAERAHLQGLRFPSYLTC